MNTLALILAAISGQNVIHAILWLVVVGVIFWLLNWLISYVALPDPFGKVARIVLAIAAAILIINALLSMVGTPFIAF